MPKSSGHSLAPGSRWITVHPNGDEGKGQPVLISGDGHILAGIGGKFNGQHISQSFHGGRGSHGFVHGGKDARPPADAEETASPRVPDLAAGAYHKYNQHMHAFNGMKDLADPTVHGAPDETPTSYGVHLKNVAPLERLMALGEHATQGGARLQRHESGTGVTYYADKHPGETYHDWSQRMAQDVMTHALDEPEEYHGQQYGTDADYTTATDRTAGEFTRAKYKEVRDYLRAEGGITPNQHVGKTGDEYSRLPKWAKNTSKTENGRTLDQMAQLVKDHFPDLLFDGTEDQFGEWLQQHDQWMQQDKETQAAEIQASKAQREAKRAEKEEATAAKAAARDKAAADAQAEVDRQAAEYRAAQQQHAELMTKAEAAARAEQQDYAGGHLRFDRSTWQTHAVDHPASIAAYNATHPEGYNSSTHHVTQELTGSTGVHKLAPPVLRSKAEVAKSTNYIERGAHSPEQSAAIKDLQDQIETPLAGNMAGLFGDVGPRFKEPEKKERAEEGPSAGEVGLFAGAGSQSQRFGSPSAVATHDAAGKQRDLEHAQHGLQQVHSNRTAYKTQGAYDAALLAAENKVKGAKKKVKEADAMPHDADFILATATGVRESMARFPHATFASDEARALTKRAIREAATRFGIDAGSDEDDAARVKEAQAARSDSLQRITVHEALPLQVTQLAPDRKTGVVQLISVGEGNAKAGNYYTEQAVRDAARLATGRRMYVSHSGSEDRARGHRDPAMMASVIKEAWYHPETQSAQARVRFLPTHAWLPAVLAEEPDAIQVSLDGAGEGKPGDVGGKRYRAVIEHMTRVDSADWVPEAGARGRFIRFSEAAAELTHEEDLEMLDTMTAQEVRESNPTLYAEIVRLGGADTGTTGTPAVEHLIREAQAPLLAQLETLHKERNVERTTIYIREALAKAALGEKARTYLASRFIDATVGDQGTYPTREALDGALGAEIAAYRATLPAGGQVTGLGATSVSEAAWGQSGYTDPFAEADAALAGMFGLAPRTPANVPTS